MIGRFTIRVGLRADNPAFPVYIVMVNGHVIGKQFSVPCLSDCEWLERNHGVYAVKSTWCDRSSRARRVRAGHVTAITTRLKRRVA